MIFKNLFVRIFLIVIIILLVIQIFISFFLTSFVNKKLSTMFLSKIHISQLNINFFDQSVSLHNLKINQPEGDSSNNLLFLKKVKIKISLVGLLGKKFHIKKVFLSNLKLNLEKDKENVFNFEKILPLPDKPTEKSKTSSNMPFAIKIDKVQLEKIFVNYSEKNNSNLEMNLKNVALDINNIYLSDKNSVSSIILSIPEVNFSVDEKKSGKLELSLSKMNLNIDSIENKGINSSVNNLLFSMNKIAFSSLKNDKSSMLAILSDFKINLLNFSMQNEKINIKKVITDFSNANIYTSSPDSLKANLNLGKFSLFFDDIATDNNDIFLKRMGTEKFELDLQSEISKSDSISLSLNDILLLCSNIIYKKKIDDTKNMPTKIELTALIDNGENYDSFVGLYAKTGIISDKIPQIDATLRVVGFELDKFSSLIPPGTYQMLGGDALDISSDTTIKQDFLDCDIGIITNQGTKLGMKIGGTPQKPKLDKSSALFNVLTRFQGGIGGTIFKVGGTTINVAKTGVNVVAGVGKGTGKVIASVGKGAFSTLKGIATGNIKSVGKGIKQATVGSVSNAGKTVLNTGKEVLKGSGDMVKTITGKKRADKWREAKKERWNKNWEKAKNKIDNVK